MNANETKRTIALISYNNTYTNRKDRENQKGRMIAKMKAESLNIMHTRVDVQERSPKKRLEKKEKIKKINQSSHNTVYKWVKTQN